MEDPSSVGTVASKSATPTPSVGGPQKDRHEPRGRKPNDQLPPSRAREVQRAFRLRRAEHLASLEERILLLETENNQLRALLSLPEADRPKIGSGPTGRGKSLKDGGVPMSERVRARKEARARDRAARGLPPGPDTSDESDAISTPGRANKSDPSPSPNTATAPAAVNNNANNNNNNNNTNNNNNAPSAIPLFSNPGDLPAPYSFNLPTPFQLPISPPQGQYDYNDQNLNNPANSFQIFSMFDTPAQGQNSGQDTQQNGQHQQPPPMTDNSKPSPMSPNTSTTVANAAAAAGSPPAQPDLLTRLKACCHLADSHVVNDPGLLIFATRLCQSYACPFGGSHPTNPPPPDDPDQMLLGDAWRILKATLDPTGETDSENRINTGRMAAELVTRAAQSRGAGSWIVCRYKEGMTIRRELVSALVQGFGGKLD